MSDQVLNHVLESLGSYRMQAGQIRRSAQTLGRGAFSDVWLGEVGGSRWTLTPSKRVAIKQLRVIGDMKIEEKRKLVIEFAREVRVWAGLHDPHIVPLVGFYLNEVTNLNEITVEAWLISPYFKNGNARQFLDKLKPDLRIRLLMLGETADGIVYLQSLRIRHGDIKSGNVLIDDQGHAKLCDFGIAKYMEVGQSGLTTSNGLKGSVRFMAPEFFTEEHPHGTMKSDNWAWCCLALEILLDKIPYDDASTNIIVTGRLIKGELPAKIDELRIPDKIKVILTQCWVSQPDDRLEMTLCSGGVTEALAQLPLDGNDYSIPPSEHVLRNTDSASIIVPAEASGTITRRSSFGKFLQVMVGRNSHQGLAKASEVKISEFDKIITRRRQTLQRRPESHPRRHTSLAKLGMALWSRYHEQDDIAYLDEAIDLERQALLLRPAGHSERYNSLSWLAILLSNKYRNNEDVASLDEAIQLQRQALLLRPTGHSEQYIDVSYLAILLTKKYRNNGDVASLDEATDLHRQALLLRPAGHSERHTNLSALAVSLLEKYGNNGDVASLDEAIDLQRQTLLLRPAGHTERHYSLSILATSLLEKYRQEGDMAGIDEAIDLKRQALLLRPTGHTERPSSLSGLAILLTEKYRHDRDVAGLDEAIDLHQQALLLRPTGHAERHHSLNGLAFAMQEMYINDGDVADLDEAINLGRQAFLLRPPGSTWRHYTMNSLAVSIGYKYCKEGDVSDLEEAISLSRQALVLRPTGHLLRHESLHDLAVLLLHKYRNDGDVVTLHEAVDCHRKALLVRLNRHPERYFSLLDLAETLLEKYVKDDNVADLIEAIDLQREALGLLSDNHPRRQRAQETLDRLLERRSNIFENAVVEIEFVEAD